jgi:hypothetical protein
MNRKDFFIYNKVTNRYRVARGVQDSLSELGGHLDQTFFK